jgi:hypothetical protein
MLYEKKSVSDHIMIAEFPATKQKGDVCKFGSIIGFSDYNTTIGEPGSVDIGKSAAIFQAANADLAGTPTVIADVYVTAGGDLTLTATDNYLFGTIVWVGTDSFDFVRV